MLQSEIVKEIIACPPFIAPARPVLDIRVGTKAAVVVLKTPEGVPPARIFFLFPSSGFPSIVHST